MPSRRRPSVRRARFALIASAALGVLGAGCGSDDVAADGDQATTSEVAAREVARIRPVDGAIRTSVDGAAAPEGDGDALEHVLLVGDSVLVLVADDLVPRLPATLHIDAVECRELGDATAGGCGGVPPGTTVESGIDTLASMVGALAADGVVPDAAVLVLANNSSVTADELDQAMAAATDIERVWWVNARIEGFGRQDDNNRLLDELAQRDPRAGVIDWFSASEDPDSLHDHVHPSERGQDALAAQVAEHVLCGCVP